MDEPDWETWSEKLDSFARKHFSHLIPSLYGSFDLRHAGWKTAIVDANIFPSGFNNLSEYCLQDVSRHLKSHVETHHPGTRTILLIAENFTRNLFYLENMHYLQRIVQDAGFTTRIARIDETMAAVKEAVRTAGGHWLTVWKAQREGDMLVVDGFIPDLILLNNALAGAMPARLEGISQPITPLPALGWHRRRKSDHFTHANRLLTTVAREIGIDPWRLLAYFDVVDGIDYRAKKNLDEVARRIGKMLSRIQEKYDRYGIEEKPFVYVKDNAGAHGRSIIQVASPEEFLSINSAARRDLDKGNMSQKVDSVIIQEGIPTVITYDHEPAEPVMMVVADHSLGGFFRHNSRKGTHDNLNSRGASFAQGVLCPGFWGAGAKPHSDITREQVAFFMALSLVSATAMAEERKDVAHRPHANL
ncbi:MAG: glutamate--cysteine ligase [DPANN group archaeon]|nr:glutamate--cysteine ligase [DPANN group archaeon]